MALVPEVGNYVCDERAIRGRDFVPRWCWISPNRAVPQRLKSALNPRTCRRIDAGCPTEFLLAIRSEDLPNGQVLVLDGSDGQMDSIQLWLRHLRRDRLTSALPVLVWAHSGELDRAARGEHPFRLLPDGVIGRSGWKAQDRWIERIETILNKRRLRRYHIDVHLDMPSRIESLERTSEWILDCVRLAPWMSDKMGRLRQTLFELGGNAIEWGNHGDPDKTVHIRLRADERSLHVMVADEGPGFDRSNLPHAAVEDDPIRHLEIREELGLREGGFGLMITRGLVDRMAYNATGNKVVVTMRQRAKS